jgi:hypothetical protein
MDSKLTGSDPGILLHGSVWMQVWNAELRKSGVIRNLNARAGSDV